MKEKLYKDIIGLCFKYYLAIDEKVLEFFVKISGKKCLYLGKLSSTIILASHNSEMIALKKSLKTPTNP